MARVKRLIDLVCACGGMIFAVLFGIGFLGIARFVPPLDPHDTAQQTAAIFRSNTNSIRTGLLVCYIGCPFFLAFGASISAQTRRIIDVPKSLIHLQVAAYSSSLLLIAGPFMIWWVAAFRPNEHSAEIIQTLNDLGWILFLVGWVPFVTWYVTTGVAILCDNSPKPIYPRWAGYISLMLGLGQTSASFLIYFKTGPFAWNGMFAWWLPACEFFTWFVAMTVVTIKAVDAQYRDASTGPQAAMLG